MKIELDLPNYATRADLKNTAGVDTSKFVKMINLANLESEADKRDTNKLEKLPASLNSSKRKVDQLDVDKLVPAPADLSKLSYVVNMNLLRRLNRGIS